MKQENVYEMISRCKNIRFVGEWTDPDGRYPAMPLFEMADETPEEWNAKVRKEV